MARRKRRSTRQAPPASSGGGPSRLSILILALVAVSLLLGAFGFYFQAQTEELAHQVVSTAFDAGFGAQPTLDIPTGIPPTPKFAFVPPEESEDINLLKQPTIPAGTDVPRRDVPAERLYAERLYAERLPTASGKLDQTLNVLLLGSDQRPGEPVWRTDVIMIAFLDTTNGRAAVLSLPRDLYVNIPTRGWDRINITDFWGEYTKYPDGGPGLLKRVIAENFDIRIDKHARVNFDGFTKIVDTLGGIDVNVPCPLEDDFVDATSPTGFRHFQVNAGMQHMDGATALLFVRQRHGSGDISRAQRQQRVVFALREKVLSPDILPKVPQLYDQLQDAVQTDFGTIDLPRLVQIGANVKPGNLRGRVVDETMWHFWMTPDGKSVLVFDKERVRAAVDDLFNAPPIEEGKVVCQ
ncbi:MAG: LCP family protein [Chloroflexi bacterium]|nr:LCP family protein [Chloroflexota bacterium]